MKKKKEKGIFEGIRKQTAPPSKQFESVKRKKPKHKKPIENDE